jgi:hypothetical protein
VLYAAIQIQKNAEAAPLHNDVPIELCGSGNRAVSAIQNSGPNHGWTITEIQL